MAARGQWIAVGTIVGLLGAAVVVGMALSPDIRPVAPGSDAPEVGGMNVVTGDSVKLTDYDGEVVLLNIWATWCAPCEVEMPSIQQLYEKMGPKGLRIVAVSVDEAGADHVLQWARDRNLTFEILHDRTGRAERVYQTTGLPETFIIDRHGVIVKKTIGADDWAKPANLAMFARLMGLPDSREPVEGSAQNPPDETRP